MDRHSLQSRCSALSSVDWRRQDVKRFTVACIRAADNETIQLVQVCQAMGTAREASLHNRTNATSRVPYPFVQCIQNLDRLRWLAYQRWPASNRWIIGGLACAGALESAYLTYQKYRPAGLDRLCGASGGCTDVLTGPYSEVLVSTNSCCKMDHVS